MEKLNDKIVHTFLYEIVDQRLLEYRDRTTVAWYRYKECGANKGLCQKIFNLFKILVKQGNIIAKDIKKEIINNLNYDFGEDNSDDSGYVIPFTVRIDNSIHELESKCKRIIFPLKESSDEIIRNLVLSIENELKHIRKDCKKYIFDEPFSTNINIDDYKDICIDTAPIAWEEYKIDYYTALFFCNVFTSNEEVCTKLVNTALKEIIDYFKPYEHASAMDAYHLAQQLPLNFVRAFFHFYEQDSLRYSQLISSLLYGDAQEFVKLFHETIFEQFKQHYYFLSLALDYFELFSKQSGKLPKVINYLSNEQEFPADHNSIIIADYMLGYLGDYLQMTLFEEQIPEMPRYFGIDTPDACANGTISQNHEKTNKAGFNPLRSNNKESVCYISHGEINKKYDLKKLVRYLTSINEFIDKILVETVNSEIKVEDCLTYFFYPFDENIRSKIREKSFYPDFRLKWGGRHLSSLKALIRLLTNTKEDATVENVFDSSEGDRLSRDYVSLRDDKSRIWKPVEKVFGKTVYNANINKKASPDTISKNESEIQAIIKIVFACKKKPLSFK